MMNKISLVLILVCSAFAASLAQDDCVLDETEDVQKCCRGVGDFDLGEDVLTCNDEDAARAANDECDIYTCLLRETKVLTPDGKIDRTAVQSVLMKNREPSWEPAVTKMVKICSDIADQSTCPSDIFLNCYVPIMFIYCPDSAFDDSDSCKTTRSYFASCVAKGTYVFDDDDKKKK